MKCAIVNLYVECVATKTSLSFVVGQRRQLTHFEVTCTAMHASFQTCYGH